MMVCRSCGKERSEKYFYKVVVKGKTYYRKKCSICISNEKRDFYLKKLEEAEYDR